MRRILLAAIAGVMLAFGIIIYQRFVYRPPNLLLGDSMFFLWDVPATLNAENGGQPGATSGDVLYNLRSKFSGQYSSVFIEVGNNDIGAGVEDATFQENIKEITWLIVQRGGHPVLCLIPPPSRGGRSKETILRLNQWLRQYAESMGYEWANLYTPLIDTGGYLQPDLTDDGLHPNERGYSLIFGEIYNSIYKR